MSELNVLLDGDAESRAQIGELVLDAVEGAIAEIDSCAGDFTDQKLCDAITNDARARFGELLAMLADPSPAVRSSGCLALAALAQGAWCGYAESMKMVGLRDLVIAAVEQLPLTDADPNVRAAALDPLQWLLGTSDALSVMTDRAIDLLSDPDGLVRSRAVRVVAHRLGDRDLAALHPLCGDEDPLVEAAIIECLVAHEDPVVAPVVLRRAKRAGLDASSETMRQLAQFGVREARELLLTLAPGARDEYTRAYATAALVELTDADCLPALHSTFALGEFASDFAAIALTRLGALAAHPDNARWITRRGDAPPQTYREDLEQHRARLIAFSARLIAVANDTQHGPALLAAVEREAATRVEAGSANLMRAHFFQVAFALGVLRYTPAYAWIMKQQRGGKNHCLALGMLGDPRALDTLSAIVRRNATGGQQASNDLVRMQRDAALAIAAIDPDAIDHLVLAAAARAWPERELGFKVDFTYALRVLADRLAARADHDNARRMAAVLRRGIVALDPLVGESITSFRRGSGVDVGYGFAIRDWFADALHVLPA